MTLIAMTIMKDRPPILVGDILITSTEGKIDMKLPHRPKSLSAEEIKHLSFKPDRLLQKLYVIQPNICICTAGSVYHLKLILQDFKSFCRLKTNNGERWLNPDEVQEYFSNYDQDILSNVVIGIAVAIDSKKGFLFTPDIHKEVWQGGGSHDFGAVIAAGSGATQYLQHIYQHTLVGSSHQHGDFMYAKQVNCSFITKFLCKEHQTLKSLNHYWGGFIETCFYTGQQFEKLSDIVFVIADAKADDDGNLDLPIPTLFIYSQYINDVLCLTTVQATDFSISISDDSIVYISESLSQTLFKVDQIDSESYSIAPDPINDLTFFTNNVAMGVNIDVASKALIPISAYTEGNDVEVDFVEGKYIKFTWPRHLFEKQNSILKEYLPSIIDSIKESDSSKNDSSY